MQSLLPAATVLVSQALLLLSCESLSGQGPAGKGLQNLEGALCLSCCSQLHK